MVVSNHCTNFIQAFLHKMGMRTSVRSVEKYECDGLRTQIKHINVKHFIKKNGYPKIGIKLLLKHCVPVRKYAGIVLLLTEVIPRDVNVVVKKNIDFYNLIILMVVVQKNVRNTVLELVYLLHSAKENIQKDIKFFVQTVIMQSNMGFALTN